MNSFREKLHKDMKRMRVTYTVVSVLMLIFGLVAVVSFVLCIGFIGTNDFYTMELHERVPRDIEIFGLVSTVIAIVSSIVTLALSKTREVIKDGYQRKRGYCRKFSDRELERLTGRC